MVCFLIYYKNTYFILTVFLLYLNKKNFKANFWQVESNREVRCKSSLFVGIIVHTASQRKTSREWAISVGTLIVSLFEEKGTAQFRQDSFNMQSLGKNFLDCYV